MAEVPGDLFRNSVKMTKKSALAKTKALELERKADADVKATAAAVIESENIRARFDEERRAYAKRYGVITSLT